MAGENKPKQTEQGAAPAEVKQSGIQSQTEVGVKSPIILVGESQSDLAGQIIKLLTHYDVVLISNDKVLESNELVIKSNESLIALLVEMTEPFADHAKSNQSVIDSLDAFKEHSAEFVSELIRGGQTQSGEVRLVPPKELEVDIHAEYVVAQGKSFRDAKDFSKVFNEGDEVAGLDEVRLKSLLNQGLIEEA